jgi:hypothetical protein
MEEHGATIPALDSCAREENFHCVQVPGILIMVILAKLQNPLSIQMEIFNTATLFSLFPDVHHSPTDKMPVQVQPPPEKCIDLLLTLL